MPCLSTCLSHSEPCENARPQNSHGKRFSVLTAAPRSENLIRSVRRKPKCCHLGAPGVGRRDKSTFIRERALFPSLEKAIRESNVQILDSFSCLTLPLRVLPERLSNAVPASKALSIPHPPSPPHSCFCHKQSRSFFLEGPLLPIPMVSRPFKIFY